MNVSAIARFVSFTVVKVPVTFKSPPTVTFPVVEIVANDTSDVVATA